MNDRSSRMQQALRRLFDIACATAGLLILSPVLVILAASILVFDGRPVLYSQMRVGRYGSQFRIWKFRTMRSGARGSRITAAGDPRVTPIGARLRRLKLDELPQLFNVLVGDMSLVGPRPEAPEYVDLESLVWRAVLLEPPGITDVATLLHRNEEQMLGSSENAEAFYRQTVLPAKLLLNLNYFRERSFLRDLKLIWLTVRYSFWPRGFDPARIQETFGAGAEHVGYAHSLSSAVDR